jgi:hypothetical protein
MSRRTLDGRTGHRPAPAVALAGVLWFLGITATAGGIALLLGAAQPPADWLDGIPVVDTWTVPALVLGLGFGGGSLLVGYGVWRRPGWPWFARIERLTGHHWAWAGALLLGVGHVVWIVLELVYLPGPSMLQAVYGAVGLALVTLPMLPAVRGYLRR